jgi:hypothetical protein
MEIKAVCLVKNEERYLADVIRNSLSMCDSGILLDNMSTDRTPEIAKAFPWEYRQVEDVRNTHQHIEEFVGKPFWIFGVDGDEIYSPAGLSVLRQQLLRGTFADFWMVRGAMLHVDKLWEHKGRILARGFKGPPSPSVVNLYNFELLKNWSDPGKNTLFHGKDLAFKGKHTKDSRYMFYDHGKSWEEDPLRCLHLRFIQRSSVDPSAGVRPNPWDVLRGVTKNTRDIYRQGPRVQIDATEFFPQGLPKENSPRKSG